MPRINEEDFRKITSRPGYGIVAGISGSIAGDIKVRSALSKAGGAGSFDDMESASGDEPMGPEKLQVGYSGKVVIRVTFYRRRLADYGTECSRAVSEKALIDCLVYAGLIQGDSGDEVRVEDGGQKKVESNEEEKTVIELFYEGVNYDDPWVKAKSHSGR